MHVSLWTFFLAQNICSQCDLVPESSVIARGQTLKACNTQSTECNLNLNSYSCSSTQDLSTAYFKFYFGQHLEFWHFRSSMCYARVWRLESVMLTEFATLQNIILCRIYFFTMLQSESFQYMLHRIWVPIEGWCVWKAYGNGSNGNSFAPRSLGTQLGCSMYRFISSF